MLFVWGCYILCTLTQNLDLYLHRCMLFLCARTALFVPQSNTQVFISACVHICMWLEVCTSPTVTSWHAPMSISKRWNENRSSNQCCRGLRAYRFPFHFPHSGKTKSDTWVNEQTTEVIWGNANVDFWHKSDPDYTSDECLCCVSVRTVCVCVRVRAAGGMARRVLDLICVWQGRGQCSE